MQQTYFQELINLNPVRLLHGFNRTLREWHEASKMPPIAFILERVHEQTPSNYLDMFDQERAYEAQLRSNGQRCELCSGTGQLAVFFRQWYEGDVRRREFQTVLPYERTQGAPVPDDWIKFYYRCNCPAAERPTVPAGLPRWSPEIKEKTA